MALIKCPVCSGTISDKAAKCPHCGTQFEQRPKAPAATAEPAAAPAQQQPAQLRPAPAAAPAPAANRNGSHAWLYVLLALLLAAACGAGVYFYKKHDKAAERPSAADKIAALVDRCDDSSGDAYGYCEEYYVENSDEYCCEEPAPMPYGEVWIMDEYPQLATHRYNDIYTVSTLSLTGDPEWIKPLLPFGTGRAAVFADRIWLRGTTDSSSDNNKIALLEYGTLLDVVSVVNDKWVQVEVVTGENRLRRGYVAQEFVIDTDAFAVMHRHVTHDTASRNRFPQAKWRRALGAALRMLDVDADDDRVVIGHMRKYDCAPRRFEVFRLSDPDTGNGVYALIEFFDGDEEYRTLGFTADYPIADIANTSLGVYEISFICSSNP